MSDDPDRVIIPDEPTFVVNNPRPFKLVINGADNTPMVTIDLTDGGMTFGPSYHPDDAARIFWAAVFNEYQRYLDWQRTQAESKPVRGLSRREQGDEGDKP